MSEWIPVEERLPEPDVWVLGIYSHGEYEVMYWSGIYHWGAGDSHGRIAPTHWMPLPDPPEVTK